jgi:hypothetical protein
MAHSGAPCSVLPPLFTTIGRLEHVAIIGAQRKLQMRQLRFMTLLLIRHKPARTLRYDAALGSSENRNDCAATAATLVNTN